MKRCDTAKWKAFRFKKWLAIVRLGSALTRAQDDPVFRISVSFSAVNIYLIQYVVCHIKFVLMAKWVVRRGELYRDRFLSKTTDIIS